MSYPTWNNATTYLVDSIVYFEGILYQATLYHNPSNTEPPNVEMREVDPLFGPQRGWTIYCGPQPSGSFGGRQQATMTATKQPYDPDDDWTLAMVSNNKYQPSPYGVGFSNTIYQGTNNNPTTPCPKGDCQVYFDNGAVYDGSVNHYEFTILVNPVLVTMPDGRTFYTNGPEAETNTSFVFFFHDAGWAYKRTFECTYKRGGDPVTQESQTFVGEEKFYIRPPFILQVQPFPPFTGWDAPYFAPGNEAFTVSWSSESNNSPFDFKLTNVS